MEESQILVSILGQLYDQTVRAYLEQLKGKCCYVSFDLFITVGKRVRKGEKSDVRPEINKRKDIVV